MKLTPWYLAALAPIAVAGCSGALLGQLAVLALTIGIFVGTLSLGRHAQEKTATKAALTTQVTETHLHSLPANGEEAPS
jgi:hypothetical protein